MPYPKGWTHEDIVRYSNPWNDSLEHRPNREQAIRKFQATKAAKKNTGGKNKGK